MIIIMLVCVGAWLTSANQGLLVVGVILLSVAIVLGVIITVITFIKGVTMIVASFFYHQYVFYRTMAISESLYDRICCDICISCVVGGSGISCWTAKK